MRSNYLPEEVVFRGDTKTLDDEHRYGTLLDMRIQKSGFRLRRWLIAVLIFLLTSLIVINTYTTGQFRMVHFGNIGNASAHEGYAELKPFFKRDINSGYLVSNKGCRIPAMDPFDPAIQRFIHKEPPLVCDHGTTPPLIESNNTAVFVRPEARDYFYNKTETAFCCWRAFWRRTHEDNAVTYDQECYGFEESTTVNAEFVRVDCTRFGQLVYRDYHAFLPRKKKVEERCSNVTNTEEDRLSILVLGLDAVSRLNFHRMMPKTVKSLQRLGAVEMLGYNKVADNTYPNLVPVLSGLNQDELQKLCWQNNKMTFDDCPFIWKKYSKAGYRTILGEDACFMTTFNYLKPGFRDPPTDYYLRPYCVVTENDIGNTCKLNAKLCVGTRKTFENLLHYTDKAAREFYADNYFAFFWQASLTHDFFNYPQLGDDAYQTFIDSLAEDPLLLNRTVLIVMSDHGMRWGDFRQTYQGRMEDSLPFVFLLFPSWWQEKYSLAHTTLRRNAHRLSTAFDLHETLEDLLNPHVLKTSNLINRASATKETVPRGISWFLPLPDNRTCAMAEIPGHWCMCHSSSDIPLNDTALQKSVQFLIDDLNGMLKSYPQCALLQLKTIKDAKMWMDVANGAPWIDYTVTVQTEPGDAIFEGSVRYRTDDNTHKLIGSVGRLNAYGKQSACVDEFHMRLYCYCL